MEVKHEVNSIPITSSEIAYLWNTYLLNSKAKYALKYAVAQCDDSGIRAIMQLSHDLADHSLNQVKSIFDSEKQSVPYGFSDEDVHINASKLYSDKLMLYILKVYSTVGLSNYGMAVSLSPRQDIRKLFTDMMISSIDLSNKIDDISLEKGIYIRTPYIPPTEQPELGDDKSILGRIIGHKRPLNVLEITSIFNCSMVNSISAAQFLGIAQTIQDARLKDFLDRGRKVLKEQSETLNEILQKENLGFPPNVESEVLNSSQPIFSDRLSMFFCYATLLDIITTFSIAKLGAMRKDVFMVLTQLSSEIVLLIKDATDLLLEREWFEEIPKNIDRRDIL